MNILIAVVASTVGMFSAVVAFRAISCARLKREFRAYATWDDGALDLADVSHVGSRTSQSGATPRQRRRDVLPRRERDLR